MVNLRVGIDLNVIIWLDLEALVARIILNLIILILVGLNIIGKVKCILLLLWCHLLVNGTGHVISTLVIIIHTLLLTRSHHGSLLGIKNIAWLLRLVKLRMILAGIVALSSIKLRILNIGEILLVLIYLLGRKKQSAQSFTGLNIF